MYLIQIAVIWVMSMTVLRSVLTTAGMCNSCNIYTCSVHTSAPVLTDDIYLGDIMKTLGTF